MLHAEMVADHVDLLLGRSHDQAADGVSDAHEGVFIRVPAPLPVAELPAFIEGAAALLTLRKALGAGIVEVLPAAGIVDVQVHVVRIAVVLVEVEAAGLNRSVEFADWCAAVAQGAVEDIGEGGRDKEEEGHGLNDIAEMNHGE